MAQSAGLAENVASTLCYALGFITGVLFLILEPYNKNRNIRFHAFQSIFLSVGLIACRIALGIVFGIIGGFGAWTLVFLVFELFGLACLILWVYILVMTYQGKRIVLPVIGPLPEKQA